MMESLGLFSVNGVLLNMTENKLSKELDLYAEYCTLGKNFIDSGGTDSN